MQGWSTREGEFVAVYHADDVYHPEIVAREVAYLRAHPDAAAVFTFAVLVDVRDTNSGASIRSSPKIDAAELLHYPLVLNAMLQHQGSFLPTPSALVRRDVYEELGPYAVDYGLRGDLDMWLRIARRHPVGLIREHLLNYRVADHNESRRYAYLRTEPDLLYTVLDQRLADGDRSLAEPGALAAYEAHRAADCCSRRATHTCSGAELDSASSSEARGCPGCLPPKARDAGGCSFFSPCSTCWHASRTAPPSHASCGRGRHHHRRNNRHTHGRSQNLCERRQSP